jgi:hypothetical protein
MNTYGAVEVKLHAFIILVLPGCKELLSRDDCSIPEERVRGTHWVGCWMGPRAGLDMMAKRKFIFST